jgi:hypothetical protein
MRNKLTQIEKVYELLADGRWHSNPEIEQKTGISYPPRRIFDLKRKRDDNDRLLYFIHSRPVEINGTTWEEYRLELNPRAIHAQPSVFDRKQTKREIASYQPEKNPTLEFYDQHTQQMPMFAPDPDKARLARHLDHSPS